MILPLPSLHLMFYKSLDDVFCDKITNTSSSTSSDEASIVQKLNDSKTLIVKDQVLYYHYNVAGESDVGWGCAYRCLQVILSNLAYRMLHTPPTPNTSILQVILNQSKNINIMNETHSIQCTVDMLKSFPLDHFTSTDNFDLMLQQYKDIVESMPTIIDIQKHLSNVGNIEKMYIGTHLWIEPPNAAVYVKKCCTDSFKFGNQYDGIIATKKPEKIVFKFNGFETKEYSYYNPKYKSNFQSDGSIKYHKNDSERILNSEIEILSDESSLVKVLMGHFKDETHGATPVMIDDSIKAFNICGIRTVERRDGTKKNVSTQVLRFDPHATQDTKLQQYKLFIEGESKGMCNKKTDLGVQWMDIQWAFSSERYMILLTVVP